MDPRAKAYVICNPEIEKPRYFGVQLVDMYTFKPRVQGKPHQGERCRLCHDRWSQVKGREALRIAKVFRNETDFSIAGFFMQLFNPPTSTM
jgi:hypothetical protein